MKPTDDMKFEMGRDPKLVCACDNCTWHYPPRFESMDDIKVWCVAWDNHVRVDYLCKRWNLDKEICLISAPAWAAKRPKRRIT